MIAERALWLLGLLLIGHALNSPTLLSISGARDGSVTYGRKLTSAVQQGASKAVVIIFREVPGNTEAQEQFASSNQPGSQTQPKGAISSAPLVSSTVINIPVAYSTLSVYTNIPGLRNPLNLTACLLARIFKGQIASWAAPEIRDFNPSLPLVVDQPEIRVIKQEETSFSLPETSTLKAFLSKACPDSWDGQFVDNAVQAGDPTQEILMTAFSIGYALTMEGSRMGLAEVAIKNIAEAFITAQESDVSNTVAAVADQLPSDFAGDFTGIKDKMLNMPGEGVFPITQVHYLHLPKDASNTPWVQGQGSLLQALAKLAISEDGWALTQGTGLMPLNSVDITIKSSTALDGMDLDGDEYSLEAMGAFKEDLQEPSISGNQGSFELVQINELIKRERSLERQVQRTLNQLLRGSGSSAVTAVMWRLMANFRASSSNPVWMSYRAIGSGGGQAEFVGANNQFKPFNDFGASDVPLSNADWTALNSRGIKVLQLPIGLSPMNFFVSVPESVLPDGKMRLSPCTVVKLFSGKIKTWNDPSVTEDVGKELPNEKVTFYYRSGSGTTGVITEYMSVACPSEWTFTPGQTVPEWADIEEGVETTSTLDLADKMEQDPYSIGYMDAGVGQSFAAFIEVSLQNRAGEFLTSQESDVSAAASELFKSGWPSDPTDDFSGVSLLNQPGEKTWPIAAMPMVYVRANVADMGSTGPLLLAFLEYMLLPSTQADIKVENFEPLPQDVLSFIKERALPLITTDPRFPKWFYEGTRTRFRGSEDYVLSLPAINSEYQMLSIRRLREDVTDINSRMIDKTSFNVEEILRSTNASFAGDTKRMDELNEKVEQFEALAIAGLVFGIAGASMAIYSVFQGLAKGVVTQVLAGNSSSSGLRRKSSEDPLKTMSVDNERNSLMV